MFAGAGYCETPRGVRSFTLDPKRVVACHDIRPIITSQKDDIKYALEVLLAFRTAICVISTDKILVIRGQ